MKINIATSPSYKPTPIDFENLDLQFLTDFIYNVHHNFVKKNKTLILDSVNRLASLEGTQFPELNKIKDVFSILVVELSKHLLKEETLLFPYITKLLASQASGSTITLDKEAPLDRMISLMEAEHAHAGADFIAIRELTADFTPPQSASEGMINLYKMLADFENDLHQHIYLEDDILYPKAIELEHKLAAVAM